MTSSSSCFEVPGQDRLRCHQGKSQISVGRWERCDRHVGNASGKKILWQIVQGVLYMRLDLLQAQQGSYRRNKAKSLSRKGPQILMIKWKLQVALRWRTEKEVVVGKGQFQCGSKKCQIKEGLRSWEVNFGYEEQGEKKNALVKLSKLSNNT